MNNKPLKPIISRIGGKSRMADRIISIMPEHKIYIEPFVGGASVYFKKPLTDVNIINDIDDYVINLYKDLKDLDAFDLELTQEDVTKEKFNEYKNKKVFENNKQRLFNSLLLNQLSMLGKNTHYGVDNIETGYKRIPKFKFLRDNLDAYKTKLNNTTILNQDYKSVIQQYDDKDALIYLDPPYSDIKKSWGYKGNPEMQELINILINIKGKFIMSYDHSDDIVEEFEKHFNVYEIETKYGTRRSEDRGKKVKEILITNFEILNPEELEI